MSAAEHPAPQPRPRSTGWDAWSGGTPAGSAPAWNASAWDTSSWDAVDRHLRDRMAEALDMAEDQLAQSPLGRLDSASLMPAMMRTALSLAAQPAVLMSAGAHYATDLMRAWTAATARAWGLDRPGPIEPDRDKRFGDPAWTDNAAFWFLRQQYLLWDRMMTSLVDSAQVSPEAKRKAAFVARLMGDAMAPTNNPLTNPAVMKKALDTGGLSLARGARTFAHDLVENGGQPQQVASGVHVVGRDLAVTPGKVVFRNDLMELIQYEPTTDTVHAVPLLLSPPWINKFYVMDLAPGRSLVQWAVDHGHTVFLISYRNPDETMHNVRMDDYLISGPLTALDVITDITGAHKINLLGLCLGGTLTMASLAYLNAIGEDRINSATFLNTLIDFTEPGLLGVFTDEKTIGKLEQSMAKTGFLPAENMRRTFDLLRGNDLIWNYVVRNWLMGEKPPAFDLLTWNADSTRMPADMHSFYLRSCYLENQLAQGRMELAGQRLDLETVKQDLYFLSAQQDHIAPWRSAYAGARLPAGHVRFVLSNAGHIAGIVNPPNPKSQHWVGQDDTAGGLPADPDAWLRAATLHRSTWWEDWSTWIGTRAGDRVAPPGLGSRQFPVLGDAPGTYIYDA